jgi:pilus assembly protein CpaF
LRPFSPVRSLTAVRKVGCRLVPSSIHASVLSPLQELLADGDITEIMINGGAVWVERAGVVHATPLTLSTTHVELLIERVLGPIGRRVDRASPFADGRLADGSRVHIVVPPAAVDGPHVTIRRFRSVDVELHEFAGASVVSLLRDAVADHANIVVSGATGAGKTTLLAALANAVDRHERVVTIEDAAELRLRIPHVVRLEARAANAEGAGALDLRELLRNALRMRPDRLIVGEVRGPEAFDMLQAMNTGHDGSMSTCHANTVNEALRRIETMVLTASVGLSLLAVRQQIGSCVDVVIHVARGRNGQRRVVDVAEVNAVSNGWTVRSLLPAAVVV